MTIAEQQGSLPQIWHLAYPDDEARKKISAVQQRLVNEYGYDDHSAKEALNYVTTLLAQE